MKVMIEASQKKSKAEGSREEGVETLKDTEMRGLGREGDETFLMMEIEMGMAGGEGEVAGEMERVGEGGPWAEADVSCSD